MVGITARLTDKARWDPACTGLEGFDQKTQSKDARSRIASRKGGWCVYKVNSFCQEDNCNDCAVYLENAAGRTE